MKKKINNKKYIGKVYNQLTIIDFIPKPQDGKYSTWNTPLWVKCKCSCGNEVNLPLYGLKNNIIKSCGCLKKKLDKEKLRDKNKIGILLTYKGETKNLSQWSRDTNINYSTIKYRYSKGMPPNKILENKNEQ